MVKHAGGQVVRVEWGAAFDAQSGTTAANQFDTLPLTNREWFLSWDGAPSIYTVQLISGDLSSKYALVSAYDSNGDIISIPAGVVNWYCICWDYSCREAHIDGGRFYSPTSDRMGASFVTGYGMVGGSCRKVYGRGAGDRVTGGEHLDGFVFEYNDCEESAGVEIEPVTFFARNVIVRHNRAPSVGVVHHGCPVIGCDIRKGSGGVVTNYGNVNATWLGGAGSTSNARNTNHFRNSFIDGVEVDLPTTTVIEANWPTDFIEETAGSSA
jgi:hypothetical protein